jgi:hypothetical protein
MNPIPCAPCCTTPQTVNIPGSPGATGPAGPAGADGAVGPAGPAGTLADPIASYGVGAPQAITAAFAMILSVQIVLPTAGTYLIWARMKADLAAKTFAASRTVTAKLRRINNTADDLVTPQATNVEAVIYTDVTVTLTYSLPPFVLPVFAYTTATVGDQIQLMAMIDDASGAGALNANEAEIVALKIA